MHESIESMFPSVLRQCFVACPNRDHRYRAYVYHPIRVHVVPLPPAPRQQTVRTCDWLEWRPRVRDFAKKNSGGRVQKNSDTGSRVFFRARSLAFFHWFSRFTLLHPPILAGAGIIPFTTSSRRTYAVSVVLARVVHIRDSHKEPVRPRNSKNSRWPS